MSNKHSRPDGCRFFYSKEVSYRAEMWAICAELKELRLRPSRISKVRHLSVLAFCVLPCRDVLQYTMTRLPSQLTTVSNVRHFRAEASAHAIQSQPTRSRWEHLVLPIDTPLRTTSHPEHHPHLKHIS
jgi:hypothetical protein